MIHFPGPSIAQHDDDDDVYESIYELIRQNPDSNKKEELQNITKDAKIKVYLAKPKRF